MGLDIGPKTVQDLKKLLQVLKLLYGMDLKAYLKWKKQIQIRHLEVTNKGISTYESNYNVRWWRSAAAGCF